MLGHLFPDKAENAHRCARHTGGPVPPGAGPANEAHARGGGLAHGGHTGARAATKRPRTRRKARSQGGGCRRRRHPWTRGGIETSRLSRFPPPSLPLRTSPTPRSATEATHVYIYGADLSAEGVTANAELRSLWSLSHGRPAGLSQDGASGAPQALPAGHRTPGELVAIHAVPRGAGCRPRGTATAAIRGVPPRCTRFPRRRG